MSNSNRIIFTDPAMSGIELLGLRAQLLEIQQHNPHIRFKEEINGHNLYQLVFDNSQCLLLFLLSQDLEENFVVESEKISA